SIKNVKWAGWEDFFAEPAGPANCPLTAFVSFDGAAIHGIREFRPARNRKWWWTRIDMSPPPCSIAASHPGRRQRRREERERERGRQLLTGSSPVFFDSTSGSTWLPELAHDPVPPRFEIRDELTEFGAIANSSEPGIAGKHRVIRHTAFRGGPQPADGLRALALQCADLGICEEGMVPVAELLEFLSVRRNCRLCRLEISFQGGEQREVG